MMSPSFAAIVRTTGARPGQLREALQSISLQRPMCRAVVAAHGNRQVFESTEGLCAGVDGLDFTVLHASRAEALRGYPLNAGLDYCSAEPAIEFVSFLDDDDVLYPFFTRVMSDAFLCTEADVVYAASNRREDQDGPRHAYSPRPAFHLLAENFIPSNAFAVRADRLRHTRVRVDETLEVAEDWMFLVELLANGFRFEPCFQTLSEFRVSADRDWRVRQQAEVWEQCSATVRAFVNTHSFPIPGAQLASSAGTQRPEHSLADAEPNRLFATVSRETLLRLEDRIFRLESSFSWRLTHPLRRVLDLGLNFGPVRKLWGQVRDKGSHS